jgi:hypothetical protein
LLTFTAYAGDFLIGLGAGAFILIVSLGACFIIFGVTPKRVHKGMELIKQAVIGLAFLAAGGIIRFIVVDLLFKRPATSFSTTC